MPKEETTQKLYRSRVRLLQAAAGLVEIEGNTELVSSIRTALQEAIRDIDEAIEINS